jgi:hypothetical protein
MNDCAGRESNAGESAELIGKTSGPRSGAIAGSVIAVVAAFVHFCDNVS